MESAERLEIRGLAREFAEREVRPRAAGWDESGTLDPEIFEKLAELGFLGMRVPERWGGLGLDWTTWLLVLGELARGDAALALAVAAHGGAATDLLVRHGSDAQRERWLPRLATGELLGTVAVADLEEAGGGARATRAVVGEDGWTLDGAKRRVTNGGRAGLVLVFARTGSPGEGGEGEGDEALACFLAELPADGYRAVPPPPPMGLRAAGIVDVVLEGLAVPGDGVLAGPAEGARLALEAADAGRAAVAAVSLGIARAAFEHATRYALEREQFGRPIADFGAIREKLAEMDARIEAAEALLHRAAEGLEGRTGTDEDGGGSTRRSAAIAKLVAGRTSVWVADEAVQVFGGYGYMREYPVEKLMRDAKGTEVHEGTGELLRAVIAREVLAATRAS